MQVTNLPTRVDPWEETFSFLAPSTKGKCIRIFDTMTSCTDYLTDWLMYPEKCPVSKTNQDLAFDTNSTFLLVSFPKEIQLDNFIKFGLPFIHRIEKINGFKLTKITKTKHSRLLIIRGSKLWMHSTYTLSFYMKLFRNLCHLTESITNPKQLAITYNTRDSYVFRKPLLWKICLSGNLRSINRGCKYKHGWKVSDQGNHSNNGIHYSIDVLGWVLPNKDHWDFHVKSNMFNNFKRRNNMLKLQEQLKDFDYALSLL